MSVKTNVASVDPMRDADEEIDEETTRLLEESGNEYANQTVPEMRIWSNSDESLKCRSRWIFIAAR